MTKLKVRVNGSWEWMQTGLIPLASVPGVSLQAPDGGLQYYGNKGYSVAATPLDDPTFFPIGVWFESVLTQGDVDKDKDTGLNVYVELTSNSDMSLVRSNGMYAIPSLQLTGFGAETIGWLLSDEADMNFGPGWSPGQGYYEQQARVDALPSGDGRIKFSNYGKGVLLRSWEDPTAAQVFINNFQQTVSDDFYWYTDSDIWSVAPSPWNQGGQFYDMLDRNLTKDEAQRPCRYGDTVRLMRDRVIPYRWEPIWGFVENGGPFSTNTQASDYMQPAVMTAAVWHMIIAGARGVIYFNHTFGGPFQGQHNFRDANYAAIQAAAKAVNANIQSIAPVINDNFAIDFVTASAAATMTGGVNVMAKYHGGKFYVFAGSRESTTASSSSVTFTIPNGVGTTATVLFESRSVAISGGQFTDTFADGNAVHIYRIDP
ncbi:MAG TPA: hypothetical protein VF466_05305 [Candidatus Saccharimonadales bacterium]